MNQIISFDNISFCTALSMFQNTSKLNTYAVICLVLIYYFIFSKIYDMASGLLFTIFFGNENIVQSYVVHL